MTASLFIQAITKFTAGVLLCGALIFGTAGTFAYLQGWLLMAVLFIPMFLAGTVMMFKAPELLKKRLNAKEKQSAQSVVVALSGLMFVLGFAVAGLTHRLGWSRLPMGVSIAASVILLLAYVMFAEVLRENEFLSRTVEVQENQRVVDTGLYGVVRHPMYSATIFLFLAMPLVLGSWQSLIIFLAYPALIAGRIANEEQVLEAGLEGYAAYKQRVRYKVIPFIW